MTNSGLSQVPVSSAAKSHSTLVILKNAVTVNYLRMRRRQLRQRAHRCHGFRLL